MAAESKKPQHPTPQELALLYSIALDYQEKKNDARAAYYTTLLSQFCPNVEKLQPAIFSKHTLLEKLQLLCNANMLSPDAQLIATIDYECALTPQKTRDTILLENIKKSGSFPIVFSLCLEGITSSEDPFGFPKKCSFSAKLFSTTQADDKKLIAANSQLDALVTLANTPALDPRMHEALMVLCNSFITLGFTIPPLDKKGEPSVSEEPKTESQEDEPGAPPLPPIPPAAAPKAAAHIGTSVTGQEANAAFRS